MLNLFPTPTPNCESSTRRDFLLQIGSLGAMGFSLDALLRQQAVQAASESVGDVNCILIWTRGGTSHHDSLDPKPNAKPEVRGDFSVIDTALPGVQFTEYMPRFAQHLPQFAVMRNLNPQNGGHGMADRIMMTGQKFNPSVTHPCFGSAVAHEQGYRNNMPPFIQVGRNIDQRFGGGQPGYLGLANGAFVLPDDPNRGNFKVRDVTPPGGITLKRVDRRRHALQAIDTLHRQLDQQPDALSAIDDYYRNAFSIITSPETQKAFAIDREDPKLRDAYGRTTLGQSCLLARRLIEAGTRFVTVTSGGWDTHTNNFSALRRKLPPLDRAIPALVSDLQQRGILHNTLVVWLTDFGRTPVINSAAGRDHWASASTLCMAGAGVPGGTVVGETDEIGSKPLDKEYYPADVAATIYTKLGIRLDTTHITPDGRPMRLCHGEPIAELMA